MSNLIKQYLDLEQRVYSELRNRIEKSKHISKHVNEKAIRINISNYKELTIINNTLTFLDDAGYHYDIYCDCSLEDLINIL